LGIGDYILLKCSFAKGSPLFVWRDFSWYKQKREEKVARQNHAKQAVGYIFAGCRRGKKKNIKLYPDSQPYTSLIN